MKRLGLASAEPANRPPSGGDWVLDTTVIEDPSPHDPTEPLRGRPASDDLETQRVRAEVRGRLFGKRTMPRVGRFALLRQLGSGGMGVVYSAYDELLDRRVAIKVVGAAASAEPSAANRMRREAQALARISHPNVVQVFEVGLVDDRLFIAMEYIKGSTLKEWSGAQERGWREVVDIFKQAGRGLHAAHSAGLIHRDFKPDNVMVGTDGRVRVLDFGLARGDGSGTGLLDRSTIRPASIHRDDILDSPITTTGLVMGTPAYMAPEQFRGGKTTAKTDQFGFCVSLYEALYGERPFTGDSRESLADATAGGQLRPPPPGKDVPPLAARHRAARARRRSTPAMAEHARAPVRAP